MDMSHDDLDRLVTELELSAGELETALTVSEEIEDT